MTRRKALDEAAMRKQRAAGVTLREIAESHGCSVTTAWTRTKGVGYGVGRITLLEGGHVVAGRIQGKPLSTVDDTDRGKL